MSRKKENMEDFLKQKLDELEHNYQTDWPEFEEKLERALFFKRMKVGAVLSAVLILISIGIFGTFSFIGTDDRNSSSSRTNTTEEVIAGSQNLEIEDAGMGIGRKKESKTGPSEKPIQGAAPEIQTNDANLAKAGAIEKRPSQDQLRWHNENSSFAAATEQQNKKHGKPAAISTNKPDAKAGTEKTLAQNTTGPKGPSAVNRKVGLSENAPSENVVEAAMLNQRESVAKSENSLEEKTSIEVASLNLSARTLEIILPDEGSFDLGVRPPMVPVKLEESREPYISPMQERNPWSLSLSFYPNFTFRKFKVNEEKMAYVHRDFIDATQTSERGGFSLNLGLKVSRRIGPITYLNSGVEYINYKTQAEFNFTNFRDASINEETGEITHYRLKEEPENISFADANLYHYLNIPLSISHQPWATDHIRLNIEAGGSFMYFLTARGKSVNYRTLEMIDISEREYRNRIGSFSVKVGATYHVSPKFNFGFEPTLMYFTNTIYTESYPFRVIPYSVGVNLKLQMKLN